MTYSIEVILNERRIGEVCRRLGRESMWFEVTPLPEDWYCIRVKSDRSSTLERIVIAVCSEEK